MDHLFQKTMNLNQKREQVVSLLREIDRETKNHSIAALHAGSYGSKSTRLGRSSVERLYELLTDYNNVNIWAQSADQLRNRLRLDALGTHDYEDPFDGKPLRSAELSALIDQLEQYQETDS